MSTVKLIEYNMASDEVKSVYDDIMSVRKSDWVNNFWKALANQPRLLKDTWNTIKSVMAPGSIDPLTKEMVYIALVPVIPAITVQIVILRPQGQKE
ncbi:MAG: hypothetical protein CM1200mP15_18840 [Dehalococcoidia bacterium]|nr:MAG: hypothetical protein CM1200mP15_18840 [Dehalococcoidia bacterium]